MTWQRRLGIIGLAATLGLLVPANAAHAQDPVELSLAGSPEGFGIGMIIGEPTGISAIWRSGTGNAVDAAVAWSVPEERFHLHVDWLLDLAVFRDPAAPSLRIPVYIGVGPRIRAGGGDDPLLGIRVPVGVAMLPERVPLDVFLELVPVLGLYPATELDVDAALGIRLFFR